LLLKNILWDYLGRFSLLFANLAIMAVLSRVLGPADFGAVGVVLAISGLASVFLEFGFPSAIIQQATISAIQLSTIFWGALLLSTVLYALIFIAAPFIATFYGFPALNGILRLTGIAFIINAFNLVPNALIIKGMRFREQSIRNVALTLLVGVLTVFLALNGWGAWALAIQNVLTILFATAVNYWLTKWKPVWGFQAKSVSEMFHYSKFLFLSGVLDNVFTRVDAIIIGKIMSLQGVGFYTRAKSMETMVQGVMTNSLNAVIFPYFASYQKDEMALRAQFERFFILICLAIFLFAGLAYINAPWLFVFLFGDQWAIAAQYYRIIALGAFAYPLSALMLNVINARGNSRDFFKAELWKKMIFLPTFALLWWSIEAFLYAWVVGLCIAFCINVWYLKRSLPVNTAVMLWSVAKYLLLLVGFLLAITIVYHHFGFDMHAFWPAVCSSVLYIICFATGVFFSGIRTFKKHIKNKKRST
jgi:teichuronic acid exporter